MAVPAILVLGGMGLVALVAAVASGGKKEEGTPPSAPPGAPPQPTPPQAVPPRTAPPVTTDGNGMVVIPPIVPRPGETDASILAWAQGMIDQHQVGTGRLARGLDLLQLAAADQGGRIGAIDARRQDRGHRRTGRAGQFAELL